MASARFTLTLPSTSLEEAQSLAELMEAQAELEMLAVAINETDEALSLWNVVGYFETDAEALAMNQALELEAAAVAPVPDVDWVRRSLEGLAPVAVGRFFLHGSHDRARRRSGGISLEIDAGTAFGTGHHGTTAGCLAALDAILKQRRPRRIFDLGCGSGVLAIAAARALKSQVLATDIDPEAIRVTRRNATLNGLGPFVISHQAAGLHHAVIRARAPFDLIFANILARPLAALARGLTDLLATGGSLILSGLTVDQLRWIKACYCAHGLITARTMKIGDWVVLVMEKPGTNAKRPKHGSFGRVFAGSRGSGW